MWRLINVLLCSVKLKSIDLSCTFNNLYSCVAISFFFFIGYLEDMSSPSHADFSKCWFVSLKKKSHSWIINLIRNVPKYWKAIKLAVDTSFQYSYFFLESSNFTIGTKCWWLFLYKWQARFVHFQDHVCQILSIKYAQYYS